MEQLLELYKNDRKRYINIMSHILRGDRAGAEDVVQEAFTRAVRFIDNYNPKKGKMSTWFMTILFNALRDVQKEMRGQVQYQNCDNLSMEDVFGEDEIVFSKEFKILLRKKIESQKNEQHQQILMLFFISGYTSTEISQLMEKVSPSNVTTVVSRFRLLLLGD